MARLGTFDPTAWPVGWFDDTAQPGGWFDEDALGPQVLSDSVSEALSATAAQASAVDFSATRVEALSVADAQVATADFSASRSEALIAADSSASTADFSASRTEALSAAESETATATFAATQGESLSLLDAQSGLEIDDAVQSESLTLTDSQDATVAPSPPANQTAGDPSQKQAKRIYPRDYDAVRIIGVAEERVRPVRWDVWLPVDGFAGVTHRPLRGVTVTTVHQVVARSLVMPRWENRPLRSVQVVVRTPARARVVGMIHARAPRLRAISVRVVRNPSDAELLQLFMASLDRDN